ncbi:Protein T2 [Borealophlyctis nickersoniae]|nr:Protein T2 [Borealophlyctis nickersoniae]
MTAPQIPQDDIPSLPAPTLRSPLYMADAMVLLCPHLIDAVAGSLPADAWEWASTEIAVTAFVAPKEESKIEREDAKPAETVEMVLCKDKRGHVVWDLVQTERNYVAKLKVIQTLFRDRLVANRILSEPAVNLIFAGIDDLQVFHEKFLAELEKTVGVGSWSTTETRIGSLFLDSKEELIKLYTKFIDSYAMSHKSMKREEKENAEYQAFMKETSKLKETDRQHLKDMMMFPVQRTTRYHLLLKELLKNTPEDHPDHASLKTALAAMVDLATSVNEKKQKEEEATGLFEAFEQTKNCPPTLITHKRKLVMDVDVLDHKKQPMHLFLCSDLLMVTQPIKQGVIFREKAVEHTYKFVRWVDLAETDVEYLGASGGECKEDLILLALTCNMDKLTSRFPIWVPAMKDVIKITHDPSRRGPDSYTLPPDVPGGTLIFKFDGFEAARNRTQFVMAMQSEMKKHKENRAAAAKKSSGD